MTDGNRPAGERWSVPISAIEHHAYCPRQAVLIHGESYFESNADTVRGDIAHAVVDKGGTLTGRRGTVIWRSLPVQHPGLGIHGICDTVHVTPDGPVPVEHKSGRYVAGGAVDLQVAAQVLCLRVMYDHPVPCGEVFAGRSRRRYTVTVDDDLVARTVAAIEDLRAFVTGGRLPAPVNDRRCDKCSLRPGCVPETAARPAIDLFRPRPPGTWND